MFEFQLKYPGQPLTGKWQQIPVMPRHSTRLGISFRPLQTAAYDLDPHAALQTLLAFPFQIIRLGVYWNRVEPEPGLFIPEELDWQIDTAEQAGKQIILCVGPLKTFGYPEFFAPVHRLSRPFPEHALIMPSAYPALVGAAVEFITRIVERYRQRQCISAWQLEHEAVDPLGVEHSWRLSTAFVTQELEALQKADPTRPVLLNGFLPASLPVTLSQWWNTRDQGDSLDVARALADWIGIDFYPRHALLSLGGKTLYLDGSQSRWNQRRFKQIITRAAARGQQLLITEGQAEPWETSTVPGSPENHGMTSCLPEHLITNYNTCLGWFEQPAALYAYLFWGAEYWLLRNQRKDPSYLQAFSRILEESGSL